MKLDKESRVLVTAVKIDPASRLPGREARCPMICRLLVAVIMALIITPANARPNHRVIVLGVDGMDPGLVDRFVDDGFMPNIKRLMEEGDYKPLQTIMPPQSPVAWSTFITGMDPGGHGIYDFMHRDPETFEPYLSMSRAGSAAKALNLGSWSLPLGSGKVEQLRSGRAFWQVLEEHGTRCTVFRMPVNFPPVATSARTFSGMGTPDVRGTPGTFSFYTTKPPEDAEEISGGEIYPVRVQDHRVEATLIGPSSPFRRVARGGPGVGESTGRIEYDNPELTIDFTVHMDPEHDVAKLEIQDREIILNQGEWSDWVRVDFEAVPILAHISATVRFYLKEVRPAFQLYVTPLQINPSDPVMPISTPGDWACDLCEDLGYFYTQELPEDTKALSAGIFTTPEFMRQATFVYDERRRALDYFMDSFDEGLLFFYFSSCDQQSHMLWRNVDPRHPGFEDIARLRNSIRDIYAKIDEAAGHVMERMDPDTTLIIMSDHGFAPFYWGVNLNSWLLRKGYVSLKNRRRQGQYRYFGNVDWKRTKAYALGLNGLYVNLKGREKNGIVEPAEYDALLDKLEKDLLAFRDGKRENRPVITSVVRPRRDFHGPFKDQGPDLIIGYNINYRSSWQSPVGEFPRAVIVDNDEAWSADHCIDPRWVPGVLITNRKITLDSPALYDLTVSVLDEFDVPPLPEMIGRDCIAY